MCQVWFLGNAGRSGASDVDRERSSQILRQLLRRNEAAGRIVRIIPYLGDILSVRIEGIVGHGCAIIGLVCLIHRRRRLCRR